jgi:hypothetical protein
MKLMYKIIMVTALSLAVGGVSAVADDESGMPDREALEAAMQACEESLNLADNERSDPSAMEECMTEKGFTKPTGGRGPGAGGRHDAPPKRM